MCFQISLAFSTFCNVYHLCQTRHPPSQLRRHRDRSALLPWWRATNPKKSPLSPPPHPLLGTHQKTPSKPSSLCQRGLRAPPSPCQLSRSTRSEAHLPPAPQKVLMPSPPCPGPRASGSPSVITLHHLAGRAQGRLWGSSRGLRPAPAGRVASSLTTPPTPTAKRRAAKRTAVSLMSSLGLQIGALLHQAKYSLVTLLVTLEPFVMPAVWFEVYFYILFYLNLNTYCAFVFSCWVDSCISFVVLSSFYFTDAYLTLPGLQHVCLWVVWI